MRTTIDLPDELFRQVKARAALRGMKLKEYVTEALEDSLFRHDPVSEVRESEVAYGDEATDDGDGVVDVGEGCVLPVIRGETTEELRTITEERLEEILSDDEAEENGVDALPAR